MMLASVLKEKEVLYKGLRVSLNPHAGEGAVVGFIYLTSGAKLDLSEYALKLADGRTLTATVMSVRGGIAMFRGAE